MLARALLVPLILLGLLAVPGLAAASPPDPAWLAGFYDDGDHDDVVAAGWTDGHGPTAADALGAPGARVLAVLVPPDAGAPLPAPPRALAIRAPPLA